MACSVYVTDFGEVRVSDGEATTLRCAEDARRELAGSPFLDSEIARRLFRRERAIVGACEAVARYKFEHA